MTDNPVAAAKIDTITSFMDLEAVFADSGMSQEQASKATSVLQQLMATKLAELESRLTGGSTQPLNGTFRRAVAEATAALTETPLNFHQATVFFVTSDAQEDAAMAAKAPWLYIVGILMVLGQCIAAMAVFWGTFQPACLTSDHCDDGLYCARGRETTAAKRCAYCGAETPLMLETEGLCSLPPTAVRGKFTVADPGCTTRNNVADPNFVGFNLTAVADVCATPYVAHEGLLGGGLPSYYPSDVVASWCEVCVLNDGTVDPSSPSRIAFNNVSSMGPFDVVALIFSTCIVAFQVAQELKDIKLCSLATEHASVELSTGWRVALTFLGGTL